MNTPSASIDSLRDILFVHYDSVTSTMDAVKTHLVSSPSPSWVVCSATTQTMGRGTSGRPWVSTAGNLLVTIALREATIPSPLLPVLWAMVGLAQVRAIEDVYKLRTSVKWPNDVLIGDCKVAGTLIEHHEGSYLVGIGVNVLVAPPVPDGGRQTASIFAALKMNHTNSCEGGVLPECSILKHKVVDHLYSLCNSPHSRASILREYGDVMDWSQQYFQRLPDGGRGGPVQPISLDEYGGLLCKDITTGETKVEYATYFY
eukprot:PhF_6_TR16924/c3_g1_i3/m.25437/K03524/birA; BirA family transcriptional regulator, biotin operon repressor / biotin-[acetyl-CoA-carboxylase] ligase